LAVGVARFLKREGRVDVFITPTPDLTLGSLGTRGNLLAIG